METEVLKPGVFSTIQDEGREGFRDIGVPLSGSMDRFSAAIANMLLANDSSAPVIEIINSDFEMLTITEVLVAATGPGFTFSADGLNLPTRKAVFVPSGIRLKITPGYHGSCAYLAIAGGWSADKILGSASTYLPQKIGGAGGRTLQRSDRLKAGPAGVATKLLLTKLRHTSINSFRWGIYSGSLVDYSRRVIRITPGHESGWFGGNGFEQLDNAEYSLDTRCDRMGYRLAGPKIEQTEKKQLISTAVTMGTIQLTGEGLPIVLMADCQTTGGYPRIAQVAAIDLPVFAQLRPGDQLKFQNITHEEAEKEYLSQLQSLHTLGNWISNRLSA